MAKKPTPASTLRRRRRRLLNRLEPLLQLDLFRELDNDTVRIIRELEARIAMTNSELNEQNKRVA
jgi:hypothetical protein